MEIWDYYSQSMNMILLAVFFSEAVPLALPITLIGLFNMYWAHKYAMLRLSRYPPSLGLELSLYMTALLDFFPIMLAVSNIFFQHITRDKANRMSWFFLIFAGLYTMVPSTTINRKMFPTVRIKHKQDNGYDSVFKFFKDSYESTCPGQCVNKIMKLQRNLSLNT